MFLWNQPCLAAHRCSSGRRRISELFAAAIALEGRWPEKCRKLAGPLSLANRNGGHHKATPPGGEACFAAISLQALKPAIVAWSMNLNNELLSEKKSPLALVQAEALFLQRSRQQRCWA